MKDSSWLICRQSIRQLHMFRLGSGLNKSLLAQTMRFHFLSQNECSDHSLKNAGTSVHRNVRSAVDRFFQILLISRTAILPQYLLLCCLASWLRESAVLDFFYPRKGKWIFAPPFPCILFCHFLSWHMKSPQRSAMRRLRQFPEDLIQHGEVLDGWWDVSPYWSEQLHRHRWTGRI